MTEAATPDDGLLRGSLRANAAFSTACALGSLVGGEALAASLGIPEPSWLLALAAQLGAFAALLLVLASRPTVQAGLAWAVVAADLAWVAGTAPVLFVGVLSPTGNGTAFIVAICVATLAFLQALGILRMQRAELATPVTRAV